MHTLHYPLADYSAPFLCEKTFRAIHITLSHTLQSISRLSALLILLLLVLILVILILSLVLVVVLVLVLILVILHFDLRSPPNEISQPQSAETSVVLQKLNKLLFPFCKCSI